MKSGRIINTRFWFSSVCIDNRGGLNYKINNVSCMIYLKNKYGRRENERRKPPER